MLIWKPDTCDCKIEYNGENSPQFFVQVIVKCPVHTQVPDKQLATVVLEECQRKNQAIAHVYDNGGKYTLTSQEKQDFALTATLNGNSEMTIPDDVWKPGVKVDWSFDINRNLVLSTQGLTSLEKSTISSKLSDIDSKVPEMKLQIDKIQIQ